jgi:trehalose 6-phosphate synthase/phosphatase
VDELVGQVNGRFGSSRWTPIRYLHRSVPPEELAALYRDADVALVTPLRDGMNLVAKEYVAARDDDDGVLILSRFTGASRELVDTILVNPYDIEDTAAAIRRAIEMPESERRARMSRLRAQVQEQNIYRWAGRLLSELARVARPAVDRTPGDRLV